MSIIDVCLSESFAKLICCMRIELGGVFSSRPKKRDTLG